MGQRGFRTAFAMVAALASSPPVPALGSSVIISEVVSGPLPGGMPRFVELHNPSGFAAPLDLHCVNVYEDGQLSPSSSFCFSGGTIPAMGTRVLAFEPDPGAGVSVFESVYGFKPDTFVPGNLDGDEVVRLEFLGFPANFTLDEYGVVGEDGTATSWEFTNGYSSRCSSTGSANFDPEQWFRPGVNSLVGPGGVGDELFFLQQLTTPGFHAGCSSVAPGLRTYCTGKLNSNGCRPSVSTYGLPSAAAAVPFDLVAKRVVPNVSGHAFYGLQGPASTPFHGGTLCVGQPVQRVTPSSTAVNSGLFPCGGVLTVDFQAWIQSGLDPALAAGQEVHAQIWYRDPNSTAFGDGLTDAVQFWIVP